MWKHEVKWIEVYDSIIPTNLLCATDPPAEGVECGHNNTTGQNNQPSNKKDICDEDKTGAGNYASNCANRTLVSQDARITVTRIIGTVAATLASRITKAS